MLHMGVLVDAIRAKGNGRRPGLGLASSFSKEAGPVPVYTPAAGGFLSASRQDVPSGAVMVFDAIISTPAVDHDGDILESKGAVIDPALALLWQHDPGLPIGRLLKVLSQTDQQITGRFAIADTDLGRDAAKLLEFGALRISHGFRPLAFVPLKDGRGYRVTRWNCLEVSLVSVPSNDQAIILAFDRLKLHSVVAKGYVAALKHSGGPCPRCDGALELVAGRLLGGLIRGDAASRKALRNARQAVGAMLLVRAGGGLTGNPCICSIRAGGGLTGNPCICSIRAGDGDALTRAARLFTAGLLRGASPSLKTLTLVARGLKAALVARRPVYVAPERGSKQWRATTIHEAGHAVFGCLMGVEITGGVVGQAALAEKASGLIRFKASAVPEGRREAARHRAEQVAFALAGVAAERWAGDREAKVLGDDRKNARRVFKQLAGRKPTDRQLALMVRDLSGLFAAPAVHDATRRVANLLGGVVGGVTPGERITRAIREECGGRFDEAARDLRDRAAGVVLAQAESTKNDLLREEKEACPMR